MNDYLTTIEVWLSSIAVLERIKLSKMKCSVFLLHSASWNETYVQQVQFRLVQRDGRL